MGHLLNKTELPDYPVEYHPVLTKDNYVLTLTRIPCTRKERDEEIPYYEVREDDGLRKPAVLLVHGAFMAGEHWFMNGDKSLPYKLVNEGYDCWIVNLRGTYLSREEGSNGPEYCATKYWEFGLHEMAEHDIFLMIDYVLTINGNKSLYYIGHSLGATILLTGVTLRPDYCSKIRLMVCLAPTVYSHHVQSYYFWLLAYIGNLISKIEFFNSREILTNTRGESNRTENPFVFLKATDKFKRTRIGPNKSLWTILIERISAAFVKDVLIKVGAFSSENIEEDRLKIILERWPSPISMKLLSHRFQTACSGIFRQYNFSVSKNLKVYGQKTPPVYDLSKSNIPVVTFYSESDQICNKMDITKLVDELPNSIGFHGICENNFSHSDFLFGNDANKFVYSPIIDIFSNF